MIQIIRTNSDNKDFASLVKDLDTYLATVDGDDHAFYDQFNKIDKIKFVIIANDNEKPAGCGAIVPHDDAMEIKRMYVSPEMREKGMATKILSALEKWASELKFTKCILETGKRQQEAINLYTKNVYKIIPRYGQYLNVENSICFEKKF